MWEDVIEALWSDARWWAGGGGIAGNINLADQWRAEWKVARDDAFFDMASLDQEVYFDLLIICALGGDLEELARRLP